MLPDLTLDVAATICQYYYMAADIDVIRGGGGV